MQALGKVSEFQNWDNFRKILLVFVSLHKKQLRARTLDFLSSCLLCDIITSSHPSANELLPVRPPEKTKEPLRIYMMEVKKHSSVKICISTVWALLYGGGGGR